MNNNVCFLIPVYPRDYHFLDFLNTIPSDINFDIIFILSYRDDYHLLESLNYNKIYKVLLLEDYLPKDYISKIINNNVIITFKKYFGLNKYKNTYKYLATIDSEIRFINTNNIYERFNEFFNNKKVCGGLVGGNHTELVNNINSYSTLFFKEDERKILRNRLYDFSLYVWFSDIPVYESDTLQGFLDYINYADDESFTSKLNWYIFDYIPYLFYLNLYYDFSFININEYNIPRKWSLESMPIKTYIKIRDILGYKPMWLIENTYTENKEILDDIILVYHRNNGVSVDIND
jgi:hypothetical protein